MVKKKNEMREEIRSNLRGGRGDLKFTHIFEKEELADRANMFATVTIMPGESIGEHPHSSEGEMYIVKSGCGIVTENGIEHELSAGDAMWTTGGDTHSIENRGTEPLVIYAIILP